MKHLGKCWYRSSKLSVFLAFELPITVKILIQYKFKGHINQLLNVCRTLAIQGFSRRISSISESLISVKPKNSGLVLIDNKSKTWLILHMYTKREKSCRRVQVFLLLACLQLVSSASLRWQIIMFGLSNQIFCFIIAKNFFRCLMLFWYLTILCSL
jgi:hypothetical protein